MGNWLWSKGNSEDGKELQKREEDILEKEAVMKKREQELKKKEESISKKLETVRKRKRDDVEKEMKVVRRKNEVEKGNLLDDKVENDNKKLRSRCSWLEEEVKELQKELRYY